MTTTSLMTMATMSMPMVSCLSIMKAILSLVPTPSVELTKIGLLYLSVFRENRPEKPPMSVSTDAEWVDLTILPMRRTNSLPFSISTPASR